MQFTAEGLSPTAAIYKRNDNEFSWWLFTYLLVSQNSPLMVADSKLGKGYLVWLKDMLIILGNQPTTWLSSRGLMASITQMMLIGFSSRNIIWLAFQL